MVSGWKKAALALGGLALIAVAGERIVSNRDYPHIASLYCTDAGLCDRKTELEKLVVSLDRFVQKEYESIDDFASASDADRARVVVAYRAVALGMDPDLVSSSFGAGGIEAGYIPRSFSEKMLELGHVFDVRKCLLGRSHDELSYDQGVIIRRDHDELSGVDIIHYDAKGFVPPLEFIKGGATVPMWKKGERIYINHTALEYEGGELYDLCNGYGVSRSKRLSVQFKYEEFKRLGGEDMSRTEFADFYKQEQISSGLSHERSHIMHGFRNRADSETVAFLDQLAEAPNYVVLSRLANYSLADDYAKAGDRIFGWFREKGYRKHDLVRTDLSVISNIAGQIRQERYGL